MIELSDYTSPSIEFKSRYSSEKQCKLVDNTTGTNALPPTANADSNPIQKCNQATQTEFIEMFAKVVDEQKLAKWLKKIYPLVERELLDGCTPQLNGLAISTNLGKAYDIEPYQKISIQANVNSLGVATWLAVYIDNAPVLVLGTQATHNGWCEHIDQCLKIYAPQRVPHGNFITFNEVKSVPVKACVYTLCTNSFNKTVFAGSTFGGDIYIWQFEQAYRGRRAEANVKELFKTTTSSGYIVAIDWSGEFTLLTAQTNGSVIIWQISNELIKMAEYIVKHTTNDLNEITSLLALNSNSFISGNSEGIIYHCISSGLSSTKRSMEIMPLKRHKFAVTTLLKSYSNDRNYIISCDLSGQICFHNLNCLDDEAHTTTLQLPLPFKNTVACFDGGKRLYCPGDNGSLECYW
uniref:WD repeat-containing protein 55 homolog n=1 Tax=Glossina pallidipes TaxID=7398 RepID=A0A1A9ZUB4_GLOPL